MGESVYDQLKEMQETILGILPDVKKFEEQGNMAAATRVTKTLQNIRIDAKYMRQAILARRKELKG